MKKAKVTDQHRATAQLAVRAFWLRHVMRVADHAWRTSSDLQLYAPRKEEVEAAAQVLADMEPKSELALAR